MSELLAKVATRHVKPSYTEVAVGDTVRVYTRIKEGEKERTQYFEGLVIRRRGGIGPNGSFTVRRIASGVGVERNFPLHSPLIQQIKVQRGAKTRRATLYTMRGLTGKAARLTEIPVKQADRDREHPWPKRYGVSVKPPEAPLAEDEKAETPQAPPKAKGDKSDDEQDDAAAKAEKTQAVAKQDAKDQPSKEVKEAAKGADAEPKKGDTKTEAKTDAKKDGPKT